MRKISARAVRWAAAAFLCACWAYALVARFTNFFLAPRSEKAILLGAAMAATGLLSVFISHMLLSRITSAVSPKAIVRTAALSMLAAAVLLLVILPPLYFPEHHLLEIIPHSPEGDLSVLSVHRYEMPDRELLGVPPSVMDLQGGWHMDAGSDTITWTGGADAKISYARLMQAGVEIVFRSGPQEGGARVLWDGEEHIIDLLAPEEGVQDILLMPALRWHDADLTRKVLVGVARITEFLGLSALMCILAFLPGVLKIRNAKTILIIAAALLLLIPLVYALDPPISFRDPYLEAAVREALEQPEGAIRQHKVQTIARLDAFGQEITDLEGIQYLRNLASLNLRDNHITDITRLSQLPRLNDLNLRGNAISDITPLEDLANLESLNLRGNPIKDISPLSDLTNLRELNLYGIPLGDDINLLRNYPKLMRLNIRNCDVTDISLLVELMEQDILQDDPSGMRAEVDIRDNPIPRQSTDGYASIRPYWDNISNRVPFVLPVFNTLDAPSFSHIGGFYESEFSLALSTQDQQAAIHYTLDGSEPTQDSPTYDQPLLISSRIGEPDKYASISEISPHWKEPIGEVFKATVVRARVFHADGSHSAAGTHTYFVDHDMADHYSLPIVSITVEPDHFFDYYEGIYVKGLKYDEGNGHITGLDANYWERGGQWERPMHIEFFDTSGDRFLAQDGGVRVHGATTRSYPQKSLRLYASDQYGQSDTFNYELFPGLHDAVDDHPIENFKTLVLRNSGNNWNLPMFRDVITQILVSHTTLDFSAYNPVIVFINGEYWGIQSLREYMDTQFLADHYKINPTNIVILERNGDLIAGASGDESHYLDMLDYIANNNISNPKNYEYISTRMDIENYIDYQISEIYAGNKNWPFDNIKYWRYKTDEYQPHAPYGQDGRWRWFLFDLDTSFGFGYGGWSATFKDNQLLQAESAFLFRMLKTNSEFRIQFINRFADHLNTSFKPQHVISVLDDLQMTLDSDMPEYIRRWNTMKNSKDYWEQNVDAMRNFARRRPDQLRQYIQENYDLPGTAKITLVTDNTEGYIRINSIDIKHKKPGVTDADEWSGIYFKGIPITLSAIPKPGYKFTGWDGIEQSNSEVILELREDLTLKAHFIHSGKDAPSEE